MNPDPKQLLQIIHNRGEQAAVPAAVHDQARAAAQEMNKFIDQAAAEIASLKEKLSMLSTESNAPSTRRTNQPTTPLTP
jgi:hypothetical protein